ncbi:hypothetical protein BV898_12224 [Hypsibius exemplaris]|uniref:Uncharacterized protein n=1 Tax=Hypsibius exemplaris TaxID=2072580 RepID=A0A1W0WEI7_HYPEX|nr:hypothetical protein BV898_12224 [Hypsibius exemplaris]
MPKGKKAQKTEAKRRLRNSSAKEGAVRVLTSDDTVAPAKPETLYGPRSEHPLADSDVDYPTAPGVTDPVPAAVTEAKVPDAIRSLSNYSDGGIDGLLSQHLKDMTNGAVGQTFNRLVVKHVALLNAMLRGGLPEDILL